MITCLVIAIVGVCIAVSILQVQSIEKEDYLSSFIFSFATFSGPIMKGVIFMLSKILAAGSAAVGLVASLLMIKESHESAKLLSTAETVEVEIEEEEDE